MTSFTGPINTCYSHFKSARVQYPGFFHDVQFVAVNFRDCWFCDGEVLDNVKAKYQELEGYKQGAGRISPIDPKAMLAEGVPDWGVIKYGLRKRHFGKPWQRKRPTRIKKAGKVAKNADLDSLIITKPNVDWPSPIMTKSNAETLVVSVSDRKPQKKVDWTTLSKKWLEEGRPQIRSFLRTNHLSWSGGNYKKLRNTASRNAVLGWGPKMAETPHDTA